MTLLFGPGGIPLTTKKRNIVEGVKRIHELGLDSLELEFVQSIFLNEEQAVALREITEKNKVALTVHGSYFINLASTDDAKFHASIYRIVKAAQIGSLAGAKSITFHAGFKQGRSSELVYKRVKEGIMKVLDEVDKKDIKIKISPELTGKESQWGDLPELIQLVKDVKSPQLGFCVDFAHKHARAGGGFNSIEDFRSILGSIKKELGQKYLDNMHIHISGINYSEKGERNHLTLIGGKDDYHEAGINIPDMKKFYPELEKKNRFGPADLKWQDLLLALKEFKVGGIVVCESPNLEEDALLLKKFYQGL